MAFAEGWDRSVEWCARPKPEALIAAENEGPVLHKRSAPSAAKLVLREWHGLIWQARVYFGLLVKELVGIQNFISQVFIAFAMPSVGSRLGAHVDDAAGELAPLGAEVVVLNLEL